VAVLKTGAVFVPLGIDWPAERLQLTLDKLAPRVLLMGDRSFTSQDASQSEWNIVFTDYTELDMIECAWDHSYPLDTPMCIFFTSGSTGTPKGVEITHRGVLNRFLWMNEYFGAESAASVLKTTKHIFDSSIWQLLWPLVNGGETVIPNDMRLSDPAYLTSLIERHKIKTLDLVPSAFRLFVDQIRLPGELDRIGTLKNIIIGGEAINVEDVSRFRVMHPAIRITNLYGPTEASIGCVYYAIGEGPCQAIPIGRPIFNTRIYILTSAGEIAPVGVKGEICISGICVAKGYFKDPEGTRARFTDNVFEKNDRTYSRLYGTGDWGRWLPDGNIEYLGRSDEQVKIRGYRVELGEIESALSRCPGIRQCAVIAARDDAGRQRLVGYVVTDGSSVRDDILTWLRKMLPEYMIPDVLAGVERLPITASGKVDKRTLVEMKIEELEREGYVAPRNEAERKMARIWEMLLGMERIGIHDNFFEVGGHSLLVMRLIAAIRHELDVELRFADVFEHPTIAGLAVKAANGGHDKPPPLRTMHWPERIPLSFAQERLWFIDRLQGSVQYHMTSVIRLRGELDTVALERSIRRIVQRHEALRTVYYEEDGRPWQRVLAGDGWSLEIEDGDGFPIRENIERPFDLSGDFMLRVILIRLRADEHILVVVMHHIASDGWSMSILVHELVELYQAHSLGRQAKLSDLPVQYMDYTLWQREWLQGPVLEAKLVYWRKKLAGVSTLELPLDHVRPAVQSTEGAVISRRIGRELTKDLRRLSQREEVTLFMTVLTAFKVLLFRHSGHEDICVGSPVAGRQQAEVEGLVGFFVNTLPLRTDLRGDPSFLELLGRVKETTLEAYEHQEAPFEKVVDAVVRERDMSRNPLFQVMLTFQNTPVIPALRLGNVTAEMLDAGQTTALFDINLIITESAEDVELMVEYCTHLFEASTIGRMLERYERILMSITKDARQRIGGIALLGEMERHLLLKEFNGCTVQYALDQTPVDLFRQQAALWPMSTAVVYRERRLNYRELEESSNQLGHYLRRFGVREGMLVPLCIERSAELILAMLGILKAGAAYVAIDPEYPEERIGYILQDVGTGIVVSSERCRGKVEGKSDKMIIVDGEKETIGVEAVTEVRAKLTSELPVYMLYTSGSTGRPKGVVMKGKALMNLLLWQEGATPKGTGHAVLQFASINFDVSFQEIFSALCFGGAVCLIGEQERKDMSEVLRVIEQEKIGHLFIPYVVLKNLCEEAIREQKYPGKLQAIFTAGEQLRLSKDIEEFMGKTGCRLVNQYGPTEAHVVTSYEVQQDDFGRRKLPPIGKPIANTRIYIMDTNRQLCGIGIPGEIYIGGEALAEGYWKNPALTAERFVTDPYNEEGNRRMYRTGDWGKWLEDGNIEFLGRRDDQVKIRGNRVELGEIESQLGSCVGVRQCSVVVREDGHGYKQMVGYVAGEVEGTELLSELRKKVPEYMVPSAIVVLERLPLTQNGKVDRRKLPLPEDDGNRRGEYAAPRNGIEQVLAGIWGDLLELKQIGIYDNFFEIGGHSLLITRMAAIIKKRYQLVLPVKTIFGCRNIAELAKYIELELYLKPNNDAGLEMLESIEI
jgi:amino acid adenylation domain-containing protein